MDYSYPIMNVRALLERSQLASYLATRNYSYLEASVKGCFFILARKHFTFKFI